MKNFWEPPHPDILKRTYSRLIVIWLLVAVAYGVVGIRIFAEQIMHSSLYQEKVELQTIRRVRIPATRGTILARNGIAIAETRPSHDIVFHISSFLKRRRSATIQNVMTSVNQIAVRIARTPTVTPEDVARHMNTRPGLPMPIFVDLTQHELATVLEMPNAPEGMEIVVTPVRVYPYGRAACHLLGWTGRADPASQPDRRDYTYYSPDMIGRQALESVLDSSIRIGGVAYPGLRGSPGEKLLLVNTLGYPIQTYEGDASFADGNHVTLSLDIQAQVLAEELLRIYRGAFIVLDVSNGDVLAMASNPGYDLNLCVPKLDPQIYAEWRTDSAFPLKDRAAREVWMPGSVIKPLVALAIMEKFPSTSTLDCDGGISIGNQRIGCSGVHGHVDLVEAIRMSCNSYFIDYGMATGLGNIQKIFSSAGIGKRPRGYILGAATGIFPSEELKMRTDGSRWTAFDTALVSIGQGKVAVSPLQVALYMSAIANNGTAYAPNLIRNVLKPDGSVLVQNSMPEVALRIPGSPFMFSQVQQGMKKVVETGGTGRRAQSDNATIYGKTGTAEVGSRALGNYRNNTWFAGFAKHQNGKIYAFATFIEDGRAGGYTNAPLVAEFFDQWMPAE